MTRFLKIASAFSDTPGPRHIDEGEFSGELFRQEVLEPLYMECKAVSDQLMIDLDDTEGYATSFLEEAFGGLARLHPEDNILRILTFKSNDEPFLRDEIMKCIKEARQQ